MAMPAIGRWGWMMLAGVLWLFPFAPCWSEGRIPLSADYAAAVAKAKREGRLLLVLHFSGDFVAHTGLGPEGEAYQSLALRDDRAIELLQDRFVATFRHVGTPATMNLAAERGKPRRVETKEQHAIAYVCLPDERVIHFIPGFVTADELLAELKLAENCYFDFLRFPPAEQPLAVRQVHLAAAPPADTELFIKSAKTRWLLDAPVREFGPDDLLAAVRSARALRTTRLDERFAGPENSLPHRVFYDALADHAGLEPTAAHLVLSEYPLVPLPQLARPLYEAWCRERFWQISPRRNDVKEWFLGHVGKGKPVLLAITAERAPADEPEPRQLVAWPPRPEDELPLADFDVLEMSLDELALVMTDANLPALFAQPNDLPRFVLYDRSGRRRTVLNTSDGISRLHRAMKSSAQPGVAATNRETGKRDKP